MLTNLLESKAKPFGSSKGTMVSMVVHGLIVTAIVLATAKSVLPPREKIEEHAVLYVAAPEPPPVHVAPEPLPKVKAAPKVAPPKQAPPRTQLVHVAPTPKPMPTLAPPKVVVAVGEVDLKAPPVVEIAAPRVTEPANALGSGLSSGKKSSDDEAGGSGKGGLGSGSSGKAYNENQVDKTVEISRNASPRYPEALRSVGVQGVVTLRFIVSADGKVEPGSIEVVDSPNKLFTDAVKTALFNTRYRPAEAGGEKVRQLVEQAFTFKLDKAP